MRYTIISAKYANQDHSSAVILTEECSHVVISAKDTPDIWQQMLDDGIQPSPYEAPLQSQSDPLAKLSLFLQANPDVAALL